MYGDPGVYFTELVEYDAPSEEGDSGAAVVDSTDAHNVVGMHIAGLAGSSNSLFTHIQYVLDAMGVSYSPTPAGQ
jgi:V8-like Glu-specific endopeptidase